MNEEQHIIQFEYSSKLSYEFLYNEVNIYTYRSFKNRECLIYVNIYYDKLYIYNSMYITNRFKYVFNISNMLYKLHTPDYYSKTYQNKRLI